MKRKVDMKICAFKRTRLACYSTYFTISSVFCLPPLLFVTFREMYGISWTQLGTLVVANFLTQMLVDLIFTFFSKKFNVKLVLRAMPLITSLGLLVYAIFPMLFPNAAYIGLLSGTVIFSVAAGFAEVLLSPTVAALPSDNPKRDMSILHSLYAVGIFSVAVIGALYLRFIGEKYWNCLALFFAALPIISAVLFFTSPIPDISGGADVISASKHKNKTVGIVLCAVAIFLGSCAENVMSNWISGFMEAELKIDKLTGDLLGMATFAVMLGIVRIWYARWGKRIFRVLFVGMIGATACYLVAGLSTHPASAIAACILAGAFTSMLWPGTLIILEEKIPGAGVAAYALMAASGDLGASFAPQLMGVIADYSGLKTGMLVSSIFPILGIAAVSVLFLHLGRVKKTAFENVNRS